MTPFTYVDLIALGERALVLTLANPEEDTEEAIEAVNHFFEMAAPMVPELDQELPEGREFDDFCMKATSQEIIERGLAVVRKAAGGAGL